MQIDWEVRFVTRDGINDSSFHSSLTAFHGIV